MSKKRAQTWTLFDPQIDDDDIISAAIAVLEKRMRYHDVQLSSPSDTRAYLRLRLAALEHEVFSVLFLDNRHRVIAYEDLFEPPRVSRRLFGLSQAAIAS